jgi:hypothetical protein
LFAVIAPRSRTVALFSACAIVYGIVSFQSWKTTTGDEPHYLILAHSIAFDWDTDLSNNYEPAIIRQLYGFSETIDPHARALPGTTEMRSVHVVGLPTLLAPVLRLGGGIATARLAMVAISALAAVQLWLLLEESVGGPLLPRLVGWAAAALCVPTLIQSAQVFPDVVAPLVLIVGLRLLRDGSTTALIGVALIAALLWWLQFRYAPLVALLVTGMVARAGSVRRAAIPVCIVAAAELLQMALYWRWFGDVSPIASQHLFFGRVDPLALIRVDALAKPFFSPSLGLFPFAPVMILGAVGAGVAAARFGAWGWCVLAAACAYVAVLITGSQAWSLPARYAMVVVPLLAVAVSVTIQRFGRIRPIALVLLGLSLAVGVLAARDLSVLYPTGSDVGRVPIVREMAWMWPRFTREEFIFPAAAGSRNTGRLIDGGVAVAVPADPAGALLFGPYWPMSAGAYEAAFRVAIQAESDDVVVAVLDVGVAPYPTIITRRELTARDTPDGLWRTIYLPFLLETDASGLEVRVLHTGRGTVSVSQIRVERAPELRRTDTGLLVAWVTGIVLGAVGLWWIDRRGGWGGSAKPAALR